MPYINLVFVNQGAIKRLNKKYRGEDKTTPVLSFCYGEKKRRAKFFNDCLGEIIICPAEAEKQNLSIEKLVVHGFRNLLFEIPTTVLKRPG